MRGKRRNKTKSQISSFHYCIQKKVFMYSICIMYSVYALNAAILIICLHLLVLDHFVLRFINDHFSFRSIFINTTDGHNNNNTEIE